MRKYTQEQVNQEFEKVGAKLLSPYLGTLERISFRCAKCNEIQETTFSVFMQAPEERRGLCKKCKQNIRPMRNDINMIRKEFESKGAILLSTEYKNNRIPLEFVCSKCKKGIGRITWIGYKRGNNQNLLCHGCIGLEDITIENIRKRFSSLGAVFVSEKYVNLRTPLEFICAKCKVNHHKIIYKNFKEGINSRLYCPGCIDTGQYATRPEREIREAAESLGVQLLSDYVNELTPVYYICPNCGRKDYITWETYRAGFNRVFFVRNVRRYNQILVG